MPELVFLKEVKSFPGSVHPSVWVMVMCDAFISCHELRKPAVQVSAGGKIPDGNSVNRGAPYKPPAGMRGFWTGC